MALIRKWTKTQVAEIKTEAFEDFRKKVIRMLKYVAEECVAHAKENGEYTDRTANLRNSITYVILEDGKIIDKNYSNVDSAVIEQLINRLTSTVKSGISLVVIAGMEYGKWVESLGYNVLTKTELFAEKEINFFIAKM